LSDVTDALQALADGTRSIVDVESFFRSRTWPRIVPVFGEAPQAEGSFAEVADAYSNRQISHDQYVRLAEVVIAVMNEQDAREDQP
jgi:hypothetical protein